MPDEVVYRMIVEDETSTATSGAAGKRGPAGQAPTRDDITKKLPKGLQAGFEKMGFGKFLKVTSLIGVLAGGILFIVQLFKRSKVFSSFMNAFLETLSAFIDVMLIPFIPLLSDMIFKLLKYFEAFESTGFKGLFTAIFEDIKLIPGEILAAIFGVGVMLTAAGVLLALFGPTILLNIAAIISAIFGSGILLSAPVILAALFGVGVLITSAALIAAILGSKLPVITKTGLIMAIFGVLGGLLTASGILGMLFGGIGITAAAIVGAIVWPVITIGLVLAAMGLGGATVGSPYRIGEGLLSQEEQKRRKEIDKLIPGHGPPLLQAGTSFVPSNMLAFLHRGEAVIPASRNNAFGRSAGGISINNIISVGSDAVGSEAFNFAVRASDEMEKQIEKIVRRIG